MPPIFKSWDLLKEKLKRIDGDRVEKRIGMDRTLVFELDEITYDSEIPILDDKTLSRWLMRNGHDVQSDSDNSQPPPPLPPKQSKSYHKPRPGSSSKPLSSLAASTSKAPIVINIPDDPIIKSKSKDTLHPSKNAHPNEVKFKTKSSVSETKGNSRNLVKTRPKLSRPRAQLVSPSSSDDDERPMKSKVNLLTPSPLPPNKISSTSSSSSTIITTITNQSKPVKTSPPRFNSGPDLSEDDLSQASQHTGASSRSATAVCISSVDALVLNEPIDDEYSKYEDDDDADLTETVLSKNLKKIRADAPPVTKPPPAPSPKPAHLVQSKDNQLNTPKTTNFLNKPAAEKPIPPKPVVADWLETSKLLQANQISSVYKDLYHFRDQLKSDNVPRTILKDAVVRCLQEDETANLLDLLELLYEHNYHEETQFWSEIVLRLKRKLSTHSEVRNYRSKMNPDRVYENYERVLISVSGFAKKVDLTLTLPYHSMMFLMKSLHGQNQIRDSNPAPSASDSNLISDPKCTPNQSLINNVTRNEVPKITPSKPNLMPTTSSNSKAASRPAPIRIVPVQPDPANHNPQPITNPTTSPNNHDAPNNTADGVKCKVEPLTPVNKPEFKVFFPDIKPEVVKVEKQENVDPTIERKVTLTHNASGQVCFRILRRKTSSKMESPLNKL